MFLNYLAAFKLYPIYGKFQIRVMNEARSIRESLESRGSQTKAGRLAREGEFLDSILVAQLVKCTLIIGKGGPL